MNVRKLYNDKFGSKKAAKVGLDAFLKTSLKLLDAYPLAQNLLATPRELVVETIHSTAYFGEKYALAKYDALYAAAEDAAIFWRALHSNALRIRLYIKLYLEYQGYPAYGRHQQPESGQSSKTPSICEHRCLMGIGTLFYKSHNNDLGVKRYNLFDA